MNLSGHNYGKFIMVGCPVPGRVALPANECNVCPFSLAQFLGIDHIFSSSLIMLVISLLRLSTLHNFSGVAKH